MDLGCSLRADCSLLVQTPSIWARLAPFPHSKTSQPWTGPRQGQAELPPVLQATGYHPPGTWTAEGPGGKAGGSCGGGSSGYRDEIDSMLPEGRGQAQGFWGSGGEVGRGGCLWGDWDGGKRGRAGWKRPPSWRKGGRRVQGRKAASVGGGGWGGGSQGTLVCLVCAHRRGRWDDSALQHKGRPARRPRRAPARGEGSKERFISETKAYFFRQDCLYSYFMTSPWPLAQSGMAKEAPRG